MKLYKIENGIGTYWVIAEHPTEAEEKLQSILDKNNYGFSANRKALSITIVAEAIENNYLTGKYLVV
jgi:hypothetical protein